MAGKDADVVTPSWSELLFNYTQETTLHGLRYVTLTSGGLVRRTFWALTLVSGFSIFSFLLVTKLQHLNSHPKAVNVEVNYNDSLTFPAVTICNSNKHRLTAVQQQGFYDVLVHGNSLKTSSSGGDDGECEDTFDLHLGVCGYTTKDGPGAFSWVDTTQSVTIRVAETTRTVCKALCLNVFSESCSAVVYDPDARACLVTSFTGRTAHKCEDDDRTEFYRRRRCPLAGYIHCDHELDDDVRCPLHNHDSADEDWEVVPADIGQVPVDNTLALPYGHYLHVPTASNRPLYTARLYAHYMNTTGACLSVFVFFLGNDATTRLRILAIDEDKHNHVLLEVTRSDLGGGPSTWRRLAVVLPAGLHVVMLESRRGQRGSSGMALDDIVLDQCSRVQDTPCMRTRYGKDYTGQVAEAANGESCLPWATTPPGHDLLDDHLSVVPENAYIRGHNYCRTLEDTRWPSCYTSATERTPCKVPYCECGPGEFTCDNQFCLPDSMICDGKNDCLDGSDEWAPCEDKRSFTCEFEDNYICGYERFTSSEFTWVRRSVEEVLLSAQNDEPSVHPNDGTHYMLLRNLGQTGNVGRLLSPVTYIPPGKKLVFQLYQNLTYQSDGDMKQPFQIYISTLGVRRQKLIGVQPGSEGWTRYSKVLPEGWYALDFLGTFSTNNNKHYMALCCVKIANATRAPPNITEESGGVSCNFQKDTCGYTAQTNTTLLTFNLRGAVHYEGSQEEGQRAGSCGGIFTESSQQFTSPDYPYPYVDNLDCYYHIQQPAGSSITVSFIFMSLESKGTTGCYDYLKVYSDNNATAGGALCGRTPPAPLLFTDTSLVTVHFHTDYSVRWGGFVVAYNVTTKIQSTVGGWKYSGDYNANEYEASLVSVETTVDAPSCLAVDIRSTLAFSVIARWEDSEWRTVNTRLFTAFALLGQAWRTVAFTLPGDLGTARFVFSLHGALYDTEYAAAIRSIELTTGTPCKDIYGVNGSVACSFTAGSQCGYVDMSTGDRKWMRISTQYILTHLAPQVASDALGEDLNSCFVTYSVISVEPGSGEVIIGSGSSVSGSGEGDSSSGEVDSGSGEFDSGSGTSGSGSGESGSGSGESGSGSVEYSRDNTADCIADYMESDFVMGVEVPVARGGVVRLLSPEVNLTEDHCLSTTLLLIIAEARVPDIKFTVSRVEDGAELVSYNLGAVTEMGEHLHPLTANLTAGEYRLEFTLDVVAAPEVPDSLYAFLTDVRLLNGSCAANESYFDFMDDLDTHNMTDYNNSYYYEVGESHTDDTEFDLGPPLDQYSYLLNLSQAVSMSDFSEWSSHRQDSFLVMCQWDGKKNSCEPITSDLTDAGQCYTFNGPQDEPLATKRTGADYGLKILLNIEGYEYVRLDGDSDQGIKVHLHTQDDVPSVADLGFAVSPGVHSLASVTYTKSHSLMPPWGNCSEIPLIPAHNKTSYTRLRCQLECEANATRAVCGCILAYMPGNDTSCTLKDTLDCLINQYEEILDLQAGCESSCPDACDEVSFETGLSYGALLGPAIRTLLTDDQYHQIQGQFKHSIDISHRVHKHEMISILNKIRHIGQRGALATHLFDYHVVSSSTSLSVRMAAGVNAILAMAETDIKTLLKDVDAMNNAYIRLFESSMKNTRMVADECNLNVGVFRALITTATMRFATLNEQAARFSLFYEQVLTCLSETMADAMAFSMYTESVAANAGINPRVFFQLPACDSIPTTFSTQVQALDQIMTTFNNTRGKFTENNFATHATTLTVLKALTEVQTTLRLITACFSEYEDTLAAVTTFASGFNSDNFTHTVDAAYDTLPEQFDDWSTFSTEATGRYLDYGLSKLDLCTMLVGEQTTQMVSALHRAHNNFNSVQMSNLRSSLSMYEASLARIYVQAFTHMASIQKFISSNDFEDRARSLKLWRYPTLNLDSVQILTLHLDRTETWRTWSKATSYEEFFGSSSAGETAIRTILESYFKSLENELTEADIELSAALEAVESAVDELNDYCTEFNKTTQDDDAFYTGNFLQLDVFFGELKFAFVQQMKGYDAITFLSEIGGYMGLILGGSCITLIEFLDLIVYNLAKKCRRQRVNRRPSPSPYTARNVLTNTWVSDKKPLE